MPPRPPDALHERARELATLEAAVDAARRGSGRSIVIEGAPGIGKTTLLGAARAMGHAAGLRVLQARGTELERPYAFGVALALLWPTVRDPSLPRDVLWGGAAGLARSLFDASVESPGDHFALIHGLTWVAMNAAEVRPLLLIVDDAQWADDPSMRWLHRVVARVADLPVSIVTAFRTAEPPGEVTAVDLARAPGSTHLQPAPLSLEGVTAMLAGEHPSTADRHGSAARIHAATGGNPFFVTELLRHGTVDLAPTDRPEALPPSIERYVSDRVARLDPATRTVAEAIAVLDDAVSSPRLVALTGLPIEEIEASVRRMRDAGILHPSGSLAFLHPIIQAAAYDAIPVLTRGRLHRSAGLLLQAEGAPTGLVASQLLAAEPSGQPEVVGLLRTAARETMARGEPGLAARMLRRALEEPPPAEERVAVLRELAQAEAVAMPASAADRYRTLLDLVPDPVDRAGLHLDLGHALHAAAAWADAASAFETGLRELDDAPSGGDAHQALRQALEAGFVSAAWVSLDRHDDAEAIVDRIMREDSLPTVQRELAAWLAFQRGTTGSTSAVEAMRLVDRAIDGVPMDQLIATGQLVEVASGVMVATDGLERQVTFLGAALEAAERVGAIAKVGIYTYCRGWPRLYMGRLADAIADAEASLRVGQLGAETFQPAASTVLALAHVERGDLERASHAVDLSAERWGERVDFRLLVPLARARIALAQGDTATAIRELDSTLPFLEAIGYRAPHPPDIRIWRTVTLLRLGQRDAARAVAEEALDIATGWGATWPAAVALRTVALTLGGREAIERLGEAAAMLEGSPARLEAVRTGVELGVALRRAGRAAAARDVLARAADEAQSLGLLALLERARSELVATGARPRRLALSGLESLTPAERRVVEMAADGATNRQIAETLFVTPKAVEFHLANAYPKLGVRSRRELPGALQEPRSA